MQTAMWLVNGTHIPVTVTGLMGVGPDGRRYVSIDGSKTGVPEDELVVLAGGPNVQRHGGGRAGAAADGRGDDERRVAHHQ